MSAKTFVDTGVLICAFDIDAGAKHTNAKALLEELWRQRSGALSTQVLQEFYVNFTRKFAHPLAKGVARRICNRFALWCSETTPTDIASAFAIADAANIGFWDALIVAMAVKAGASKILSEDMSHGQRIAGVLIENPFIP